ncbi:hypothetical protein Tco_0680645 [Tanacetum coccineum]|uniref:Uncharacterized protein n=1 Tax=Tanacetum coccineum TaxID=301880 RepID=A0ABQ4XM18_9ASTR
MKVTGRRTYDSLNGKWKTMRPKVAQFCRVYNNVVKRAMSGAVDEDYTHKALFEYQGEYEVPFTLLHVGWKPQGRGGAKVQRPMGRDKAKKKPTTSSASSASVNKEALARLVVSEYASLNEP